MPFIPEEQYIKQEGFKPETPQEQPTGKINFLQRLKLGFGGPAATKKSEELEKQAGLAGKPDIGDIADIAGRSLPIVGGMLGVAGGTIMGAGIGAIPGMAMGSVAGESMRQAIGRGLGGREGVSLGQEAKDIASTGAGAYIGGKVVQTGLKLIKPAFSRILGLVTSESSDNITMILKNPRVADSVYREGDTALRKMVGEGSRNSVEIRSNFYKGAAEIYNDLLGGFRGFITSSRQLKNDFVKDLSSKGVKLTKKGLDFSTSKIASNPGEVSRVNSVYKLLSDWKDFTSSGTRELRQLVGNYTSFPDVYGMPAKSTILSRFYHGLNDKIASSLPKDYADLFREINKAVSSKGDLYDDMVKAFNSGDPFTTLANSLSRNKDTLRQALELFTRESGKQVLPLVAAREVAAIKPAQFFLNPRAIIDAFYTPKAQLKTIITLGRISNLIENVGGSLYKKYQSMLGVKAIPVIHKLLR